MRLIEEVIPSPFLKRLLIFEPQNTEQVMSNFEVFSVLQEWSLRNMLFCHKTVQSFYGIGIKIYEVCNLLKKLLNFMTLSCR